MIKTDGAAGHDFSCDGSFKEMGAPAANYCQLQPLLFSMYIIYSTQRNRHGEQGQFSKIPMPSMYFAFLLSDPQKMERGTWQIFVLATGRKIFNYESFLFYFVVRCWTKKSVLLSQLESLLKQERRLKS